MPDFYLGQEAYSNPSEFCKPGWDSETIEWSFGIALQRSFQLSKPKAYSGGCNQNREEPVRLIRNRILSGNVARMNLMSNYVLKISWILHWFHRLVKGKSKRVFLGVYWYF